MNEVISWFGQHAARLAGGGYDVIPITRPTDLGPAAGKRPAMPNGWQQGCPQADWPRYADYGVGILASRTPGIDIDVLDEALGDHIQDFADRHLGEAAIRVGQWPKRLLVFRNDSEPFTKMRVSWRGVGDEMHEANRPPAVEILADGQQYVVAGVHPATGRPYHWRRDPGLAIPRAMLPALDENLAARFVRALAFALQEMGANDIKLSGVPEPVRQRAKLAPALHCQDEGERIRAALERIGNPDVHYDDWIRIGHAIKGSLGQGGAEIFFWWSSISDKNDPDLTRRKWATFKPRAIGAGTIFFESIRYA